MRQGKAPSLWGDIMDNLYYYENKLVEIKKTNGSVIKGWVLAVLTLDDFEEDDPEAEDTFDVEIAPNIIIPVFVKDIANIKVLE